MSRAARAPWRISLHGGHSGAFCAHATGTLDQVLEAALAAGMHTYGLTEHAPRPGEPYLYDDERALGYTVVDLERAFARYAVASRDAVERYTGRLNVVRGFEAEVVPRSTYAATMRRLREAHGFDYLVGSVHFVGDHTIDGSAAAFGVAVEAYGGTDRLAEAYYRAVAEMVAELRPEVVGHLDVIKRNAGAHGTVDGPCARAAARDALAVVREVGSVLELNTAGWRLGLGEPYPAPWLVAEAGTMGIPFCFGDDSHGPTQVGLGIDAARYYLLAHGVRSIATLDRESGALAWRSVGLEP